MTPLTAGFPATTPCSATGAAAAGERADPGPGDQHAGDDRHVGGQLEPGRRGAERVERTGVVAPADACSGAALGNWVTAPAGV